MKFPLVLTIVALFSHSANAAVVSFEWACYTELAFLDLISTFEQCIDCGVNPGKLTISQLDDLKFQAVMGKPSTALEGFMDWTNDWISVYQDCQLCVPEGNPANNFIDMLIVNILVGLDPTTCSIESQLIPDLAGKLQPPDGFLPGPVDILEWFVDLTLIDVKLPKYSKKLLKFCAANSTETTGRRLPGGPKPPKPTMTDKKAAKDTLAKVGEAVKDKFTGKDKEELAGATEKGVKKSGPVKDPEKKKVRFVCGFDTNADNILKLDSVGLGFDYSYIFNGGQKLESKTAIQIRNILDEGPKSLKLDATVDYTSPGGLTFGGVLSAEAGLNDWKGGTVSLGLCFKFP